MQSNEPLPTFMWGEPRLEPPPRPPGVDNCDQATLARWAPDEFRFPPYQYKEQFVTSAGKTVNAATREVFLCFKPGHTVPLASCLRWISRTRASLSLAIRCRDTLSPGYLPTCSSTSVGYVKRLLQRLASSSVVESSGRTATLPGKISFPLKSASSLIAIRIGRPSKLRRMRRRRVLSS